MESKNLVGIFLCIFVKKKLMSAISEVQGTTAGVGMLGVMVRAVCLRFVFSVRTRAHATFAPTCQRKQPFASVGSVWKASFTVLFVLFSMLFSVVPMWASVVQRVFLFFF